LAADENQRTREMSQGFTRQRRNLLLLSILMPLFFLSGAEVEKLNLLGTIVTINNQVVIKWSIVLVFVYFCIRYWQYYKEERCTKNIGKELRRSMYRPESKLLAHRAHERAKAFGLNNKHISFANKQFSYACGHRANLAKEDEYISFLSRKTIAYLDIPSVNEGSGMQEIIKDEDIPRLWEKIDSKGGAAATYQTSIEYKLPIIFVLRTKGILAFIVNQSYFSDYQLPFVVAAISALTVLIV